MLETTDLAILLGRRSQGREAAQDEEVLRTGTKQETLDRFKERRISVPPFAITTNGLTIEFVPHGVTKEHVERLDAVIFGEIYAPICSARPYNAAR